MNWLKIMMVSAWLMGQLPDALQTEELGLGGALGPIGGETLREFKLTNGDTLRGELASAKEEGLVVRLEVGGFSDQVPWTRLSQETLKRLTANPQARHFVEPFIEIPPELKAKRVPKRKVFHPKPVPRVELPPQKMELMATVTAPFNLAVIGLFLLANLYAAYEIAVFRKRPAPLICGVSALVPVLGPIFFLMLPTRYEEAAEGEVAEAAEAVGQSGRTAAVSSSLSMAKMEKAAPKLRPATYTRNDTTFDRRFFETKFPGFFRVVLGDAEKDFVLVIRTVRDEYVAQRIARITAREMHIQLRGTTIELVIPFGEITQVQVRHKDARP